MDSNVEMETKNFETANSWETGIVVSKSATALVIEDKQTKKYFLLKLAYLRNQEFATIIEFSKYLRNLVHGSENAPLKLSKEAFHVFETL